MKYEEKIAIAENAITEVFSDDSVSLEDAIVSLQGLRDDIDMKLSALEADFRRQENSGMF